MNNLDAASNNNHSADHAMGAAASSRSSDRLLSYNIPASHSAGGSSNSNSSTSSGSRHSSSRKATATKGSNGQSSSGGGGAGTSTNSSSSSREYMFIVHHNAKQYRIKLNGQCTVNDLKERIAEQTGIVACRQALGGWPSHSKRDAQTGTAPLRSLSLARETDLNLTDLSAEGFLMPAPHELDVVARLNSVFLLNVVLEPEGRLIPLRLPGVTSYLDVKNSVCAVTNIAPRHQAWTGWPRNVTDSTTLAQSGVEVEHNFTVKSSFLASFTVDGDADEEENNDRVVIDDDLDLDDEEDDDFEMPSSSAAPRRTTTTNTRTTRGFGRSNRNNSSNHTNNNNNNNNNMQVFEVDSSEDEIESASDEYNADDDLLEDISNMHRSTALSE